MWLPSVCRPVPKILPPALEEVAAHDYEDAKISTDASSECQEKVWTVRTTSVQDLPSGFLGDGKRSVESAFRRK